MKRLVMAVAVALVLMTPAAPAPAPASGVRCVQRYVGRRVLCFCRSEWPGRTPGWWKVYPSAACRVVK